MSESKLVLLFLSEYFYVIAYLVLSMGYTHKTKVESTLPLFVGDVISTTLLFFCLMPRGLPQGTLLRLLVLVCVC